MKDKKSKSLRIFLIFIGLLTFLPLIQDVTHLLIIKGLDGAIVIPEEPTFNLKNWNNSKFQEKTSLYLKHNSSFRPDFVRINNQLDYWFFNEINTLLTLGKENYLFDPNYIAARKGEDYLTLEQRNNKKEVLSKVKQYLDSLDIPILFCLAPNKANYYAEYLPIETQRSKLNNQFYFEELFKNQKIAYINFDNYFQTKKEQAISPLMPKYGAHWSTYGAYLCGVKLFDTINYIKNEKCIEIIEDSIIISNKALYTDDDYIASLNLIKRWKSTKMMYPKLSFNVPKKLNTLIIADSFFWTFYDLKIVPNCFSTSSEYWYYNRTKFNTLGEKLGSTTESLTHDNIKHRDLIIIMTSDPGLKDLGFGFLEQLVDLYED